MRLDINDESITYATGVSGTFGENLVLLDGDDDLTAGTSWTEVGYTVAPFLDEGPMSSLRDGITALIAEHLASHGIATAGRFALERYHRLVGSETHAAIAREAGRGFPAGSFPLPLEHVVRRVSEICGKPLTALEPGTPEVVFNLRLVRPASSDNNPLHRDAWLDHLRNAVNIYVPIAGSDARSSLALVPGSHRWRESEIARTAAGAVVNSVRFTVPSVVGARRPLMVTRPNPAFGEVLVFSPYLIHGGASNLNPDSTRVSLEMRFWRCRD